MMLELASRADLINAAELFFPGISQRKLSKFVLVSPSDPTMIGIIFAFALHGFCTFILRS